MNPLDTNVRVGALLRELATAQTSQQSRWGYRRAAQAILALDEPLENLLQPDGTLRKIPNVGPSSTRVILEVLRSGESATVDRAVAESPRRTQIARGRQWQEHFLSRAQVTAALEDKTLAGPALRDYRGDLQMHSTFSDGRDSLRDLVEGCLARGYRFCAVTDHSYGLPIARGVSMANLARQHTQIATLNRKYAGRFRMFKGIEVNILADGRLDMTAEELRTLEVIVAAPHSKLRTGDDQTMRMIAAMSTPGVHILGHPRGRKFGARPGVSADWPLVFAAAKKLGVAVEIDGDPSRQDIDYELAKAAVAAGCLIALDSDAHSVGELHYAETAIAHARLAGVPRTRILNCWTLEKLAAWLPRAWRR
jgi:putative hydrolase